MGSLAVVRPPHAEVVLHTGDLLAALERIVPSRRLNTPESLNALARQSGQSPESIRVFLRHLTNGSLPLASHFLMNAESLLCYSPPLNPEAPPSILLAVRPHGFLARRLFGLLRHRTIRRRFLHDAIPSDVGVTSTNNLISVANPSAAGLQQFPAIHCLLQGDVLIVGSIEHEVQSAAQRLLNARPESSLSMESIELSLSESASKLRQELLTRLLGKELTGLAQPLFDAPGTWHVQVRLSPDTHLRVSLPLPQMPTLQPMSLAATLSEKDVAAWSFGLTASDLSVLLTNDNRAAQAALDKVSDPAELLNEDGALRPLPGEILQLSKVASLVSDLDARSRGGVSLRLRPRSSSSETPKRYLDFLASLVQIPLREAVTIPGALAAKRETLETWQLLRLPLMRGQVPPVALAGVHSSPEHFAWTDHTPSYDVPPSPLPRATSPAVLRGRIRLASLATFLRRNGAQAAHARDIEPSVLQQNTMRDILRADVEIAAAGPRARGEAFDAKQAVRDRMALWRAARSKGGTSRLGMLDAAALTEAVGGVVIVEGQVEKGLLILTIRRELR